MTDPPVLKEAKIPGQVPEMTLQNGHILGCAYDLRTHGHTIRYVPIRHKGRKGLTVPECICSADVCDDNECPDHGTRVFNRITGWHDEPSIDKDGYR